VESSIQTENKSEQTAKPTGFDWKGLLINGFFNLFIIAFFGGSAWQTIKATSDHAPWYFILLICIALLIGEVGGWALYALFRNINMLRIFNKDMKCRETACKANIDKLSSTCDDIIFKRDVSTNILTEPAIRALESGVHKDKIIIVLTSKFTLERGVFLKIIVDNIRKGITYQYLIPNDQSDDNKYSEVVQLWQQEFVKILNDKDICETLANAHHDYSSDYVHILDECRVYHKIPPKNKEKTKKRTEIAARIKKYFESHVKAHEVDKPYSCVTIIMYAKEKADTYDIIMKLPTSQLGEGFVAFLVPEDDNDADKKELVKQLSRMCGVMGPPEGKFHDVFGTRGELFIW
jgi:hypothetical protein